jgi:hypothetical protein
MTAVYATKLDGIATGAKANDTDANLKARANHTGTQLAATISDFETAVAATASVTANTAKVTNASHTGDVTGSGELTIGANKVTNAKFRQGTALSVVGVTGNANADVADITAATDGDVLRRSGTAIGFGTIATAGIANDAVTFAKIQNSSTAGMSVVGRSTNTAGDFAEIIAGTDGHVLTRVSATSMAFGQVGSTSIANNAVDNTKFRQGAALSVVGVTGNATVNVADIVAGTDHHVLRRSGTSLGFGLLTGSNITTNTIANANLATVPSGSIKGRLTVSTGSVEDLTAASVRTIIELGAPIYIQTATPTPTVTNSLWYDIN